jgi:hypothetical protein
MSKTIFHGTFLSNKFTISDYLVMENEKDKARIIEFIKSRFTVMVKGWSGA